MEIKIKDIDAFAKQFLDSLKIAMAHQGRVLDNGEDDVIVGEFVKNLKANSD